MKFPKLFRHKGDPNLVVRFTNFSEGDVVNPGAGYPRGFRHDDWVRCNNIDMWEPIELELPTAADESANNGGKTDYYQLPVDKEGHVTVRDFDDFAEWRGLNGFQFNMGKVMWTFNAGRHEGTSYERELNKIIHYAKRELKRIKK